MSNLSYVSDPNRVLVADTSFLINVNATSCAGETIECFPARVVVTNTVYGELLEGERRGYGDASGLRWLVGAGLMSVVELDSRFEPVFERLITGPTGDTLDDGEAATIAYALQAQGVALIDEKKAKRICDTSFPSLPIVSTIELLLHPEVRSNLGDQGQNDAIFDCLRHVKMRVPGAFVADVLKTIGAERASECRSLPKAARLG